MLLSEGMASSKPKKKDGFPSMRLGHGEAERQRWEARRAGRRVAHSLDLILCSVGARRDLQGRVQGS